MEIVKDLDILLQKSKPITLSSNIAELETLLIKEVKEHKCKGLSLIQLGIARTMFVFVLDNIYTAQIMINPEILEYKDKFIFPGEGCLSFPGENITTIRYKTIKVKYYEFKDGKLEEKINEFGNINSIAIQHEMDHLNGLTMHDRQYKKEQDRNDPCECGSGKKYKKCCGK